jgi:2-methylisocitrate lyase-like PEP mutase family enzyme
MAETLNRRLRAQLARRDAMLVPDAANALAARIIEDVGFEAVYVSGAGIANSFLGAPDIGLVTASELAGHVAAVREAVSIPLLVDADTGFGNPLNVARTVKVLERSGANAIQLEDQSFPKRCGHFAGKSVIATAEMTQKIRAAADARRDHDLVLVARTDALAEHGLEAALERAAAFIEAGADMIFVEAPRTVAELGAIPRRVAVPVLANLVAGGVTPMVERAELARMGFAIALYANAALQAAIEGMQEVLRHLREQGSLSGVEHRLASFSERQRIVAKPLYDALDEKYGAG